MRARVGPFEIRKPLGSGGMGEVYQAFDLRLNREVAIKVLSASALKDPEAKDRFTREARTIARLDHPHICTLYEFGQDGDDAFLVMQLLEGETLATRLARGRLPIVEALRIAVDIGEAIDAAHGKGITHRDIKPSNIMLTKSGAVLLDFGLAKLQDWQLGDLGGSTTIDLSRHGVIVGTVRYMAPEVLDHRPADARSDLFSFGAVLYEMITGQRAFPGDSEARVIAAIIGDEPRPLRELRPDAPPALETLVGTCLAKDPDQRWQHARDLVLQLRAVTEAPRHPTPDPAPAATDGPWRLPIIVAAALGVIVVGVLGVRELVQQRAVTNQAGVAAGVPHLVVLPCTQTSEVAAAEVAQCDGLAATLASTLSELTAGRLFQVTPAVEVRAGRVTSVEDARRQLGATLALQGRVDRSGRDLRFAYALLDTGTRATVGDLVVPGEAARSFDAGDRLLNWVISVLQVPVNDDLRAKLRARGTQVPDAYSFALQAAGYLLDYQRAGAIDIAINLFKRAITADARYGIAHAGLGQAYWLKYEATKDAQYVENARTACRDALNASPDMAAPYLCAGTIESGTGEHEQAIVLFERALQIDPSSDEAYRRLGRAHEALGRWDAAQATYTRAVTLRPQYWATHVWLASFYRSRARYDEAAREYEQAIALTPDNAPMLGILAGQYMLLGRYDEALRACQTSLGLWSTPITYVTLGMIQYRMRQFDASIESLEKARSLLADFRSLGNLARAYQWAGNRDRSRALFEEAVQLGERELDVNPRHDEVHVALADYYARLGRREEAVGHLARARMENPHFMMFAAMAYGQLGDLTAAREWLQKARSAGLPPAEVTAWIDLDAVRK